MKHRAILEAIIVLALIMCSLAVWKLQPDDTVAIAPSNHTWSEYKNEKLGFSVQYPDDVVHPREITEPASSDGIFPGAETVVFFDGHQQRYFSLWIQPTNASNAEGWFKEVYGPDGKGWHISTTTMIAGIKAVSVVENTPSIAHDNYNLSFVHGGNAWSLSFDDSHLSAEDITYMSQSFRILR